MGSGAAPCLLAASRGSGCAYLSPAITTVPVRHSGGCRPQSAVWN